MTGTAQVYLGRFEQNNNSNHPSNSLVCLPTLRKELPYDLQNLLLHLSTVKVAHVTSIGEGDPAHTRIQLKERHLADVVRCVVLPVIDKGRGCDLGKAWDAAPT